jgi:drug/metabolite transporter (DMT)-like permease
VTRALPPVTTSLGMLGVPLIGIVSSVLLLGEKVTASLAAGTALVLAGMAIVILENARPRR